VTISVEAPSVEQLLEIGRSFGLHLTAEDGEQFRGFMLGTLASYRRIDELAEPKLPVRYLRLPGHRPVGEENPHNAWYWKCEIVGAGEGVLAGWRVAIKDNICVAGVPMANGSRLLEGYVPDVDATVVTRILDAGGIIAGKAACEDLCFSAGSHTCATGPIRNPHHPRHSAGGSSGGSAALIAAGEVEMAMGGDQGGSIRTPSCWCGVYGLKPTWGLVPCSGAMPIAYAVDHLGPMASSPENVARLLTAIAGADPHDPRTAFARTGDYMGALRRGVQGLRVGILREGFAHPESDPETDDKVRAAIQELGRLGATVDEISVPMHLDGPHIWTAIILEGATELMLKGNGQGNNWNGYYTTSLLDVFARGWRSRPDDLSDTCKLVLLLGEYLNRQYHGRYHAKGQNLKPVLKAAYDAALQDFDILAMPTIPFPATKIPAADAPREERMTLALNMQHNTCPFDVSGHPAFTVPCGLVDGLPVGMMLVGRHMEEAALIAAAQAFAETGDWKSR
jgi:amidase